MLALLRRRPRVVALTLYALLLTASWTVREVSGARDRQPAPERDAALVEVPAFRDGEPTRQRARVAVRVFDGSAARPPVVLLHGSPGEGSDVDELARLLAGPRRVIVPDLPGFGASSLRVPEYSHDAHARAVLATLDELGVARAHVVGFSMGGGVGIRMGAIAPHRVVSLTLLSSIGVQELELLGTHTMNRAVHAVQLGALWLMQEAVPHFGLLDGALIGVPYARNFFDSDQRPLREMLLEWQGPTLIVHGDDDVLVPVTAAREHARIVPQSRLWVYPGSHFTLFTEPDVLVSPLATFLRDVEAGRATTRAGASPERIERASVPFDPSSVPSLSGIALVLACLALALATLVSEDLACIAAGILVAEGRIEFFPAVLGCFAGIYLGDVALFLAGRLAGRASLRRAPLKWMITPEQVDRSCAWFRRRGLSIIIMSRFMPGTRLPTYFAAGLVGTPLPVFAGHFFLASVLWTPALVGVAALVGARALAFLETYEEMAPYILVGVVFALLIATRVVVPATTRRGRRLLVGSWRRWTRWEFWPPWLFYVPVVGYVATQALRHGGLSIFTASNPGMPDGGFVGESKSEILGRLAATPERVARHVLLRASDTTAARVEKVERFVADEGLELPIVVKPDVGQRGSGVKVVRSWPALLETLGRLEVDAIVQEFVPGPEFGVFYVRRPDEERGRIFSITRKVLPRLVGDGRRTLEELILDDPRAVAMARHYLAVNADRAMDVPARGEEVELVDLGTHCRGAIFLDGADLLTHELEQEIDRISRGFEGFFFGRYDVRTPSEDELREARAFKILELNGVTSEATHVYDPKHSLRDAYRTLFEQWKLAFEIGAANARRGHRPSGTLTLIGRLTRTKRAEGRATKTPSVRASLPPGS